MPGMLNAFVAGIAGGLTALAAVGIAVTLGARALKSRMRRR